MHAFTMRAVLTAFATLLTVPALAATPFDGVWIFDDAPPRPGVTMMEITSTAAGGEVTGRITSQWYGPIEMLEPRIEDGVLHFRARNLNDRERPFRDWTVSLQDGEARLHGGIWFSDVAVAGRPGTAAEAAERAFRMTELPTMDGPIPTALSPTPPMGWSSWNRFGADIDDATVRAMADAMVATGLRDAGYLYVNIDDGWQGNRGADGVLQPNAKFPDMRALTDYVHARGLKIGIYSSQGPRTCAGYEGSYGHVRQDAQTFADWGFDYLKYDLCSGEWFYDDADTVQRSYHEMGAALQATGRPMIYSLCEYGRFEVGRWGRDVGGHLWRTTGDITDDYATMAQIGFDKNGNSDLAGPHGWNDPDMLEIGNGGMSADEYRTHMTLWAMSAAPLMMGHDLRETTPEALKLLSNRQVIAVDQDPLGRQGRAVRKEGAVEVWTKPLADGGVALAVFNRGEAMVEVGLSAADSGKPAGTAVQDLWSGEELPTLPANVSLPGHGARLYRLR